MEFNPPATDEDGLADEEIMPLDGDAESLDGEGSEAVAHEGSDNDEDPDA